MPLNNCIDHVPRIAQGINKLIKLVVLGISTMQTYNNYYTINEQNYRLTL